MRPPLRHMWLTTSNQMKTVYCSPELAAVNDTAVASFTHLPADFSSVARICLQAGVSHHTWYHVVPLGGALLHVKKKKKGTTLKQFDSLFFFDAPEAKRPRVVLRVCGCASVWVRVFRVVSSCPAWCRTSISHHRLSLSGWVSPWIPGGRPVIESPRHVSDIGWLVWKEITCFCGLFCAGVVLHFLSYTFYF